MWSRRNLLCTWKRSQKLITSRCYRPRLMQHVHSIQRLVTSQKEEKLISTRRKKMEIISGNERDDIAPDHNYNMYIIWKISDYYACYQWFKQEYFLQLEGPRQHKKYKRQKLPVIRYCIPRSNMVQLLD